MVFLPALSKTKQYAFGLKSGEILKQIHSIPAPETQENWHVRFNRKTDFKIQKYNDCGIRFKDRPQCFQHGDYHIGNMMIENGELVIVDFDRFDFGDPWEEFNRIVWSAQCSPYFAAGMIDGYFDKNPSMEFWKCLAFYIRKQHTIFHRLGDRIRAKRP